MSYSTADSSALRILVVEDAPAARKLAVRMLKGLGHDVQAVSNAAEALVLLDQGDQFDILFTDIIMPGEMDGVALAHAVRARDARIKIIFTSGFSVILPEDILRLDATYVAKPYRKPDIAAILKDIILKS